METATVFYHEHLRDFFDHAPVGFHMFGPDRTFMDINQAELQMIGYKRSEIVGKKTWGDLIVDEDKPVFEKHWEDINKRGTVRDVPYTLVHKNGSRVEVILNASARFDAAGKLINTRGSVLDVTRRNQMERQLRSSELEILVQMQAEKKKVKENVVHNVDQLIRPLLSKLKRKGTALDKRNVDLLAQALDEITSEFGGQLIDRKWGLSRREIEICHMIKEGIPTKTIADLLCVSTRTVDNHRDHIRKKLNITQQSVNLTSYLKDLFDT